MKQLILIIIGFYQKTISPDHGVFSHPQTLRGCRFYPSCSMYTCQAIKKMGIVKGGWFGVKRLSRCHPFSSGGYDPVPYPEKTDRNVAMGEAKIKRSNKFLRLIVLKRKLKHSLMLSG